MYEQVGSIPEPRKMAEFASLLSPLPSEQGYCTTDRQRTQEIYEPLLCHALPHGLWKMAMLAIVWPHGSIYPHADGDNEYDGCRRYHIVLQNNQLCWHLHDGKWQKLKEGGIYVMNPLKEHAAINWGGDPRIHLVVDVKETGELQ